MSLGHPAGVPAKMPFSVRFSIVNNRKSPGHRPVDPCLSRRVSQGHPAGVPGIFLSLCALGKKPPDNGGPRTTFFLGGVPFVRFSCSLCLAMFRKYRPYDNKMLQHTSNLCGKTVAGLETQTQNAAFFERK